MEAMTSNDHLDNSYTHYVPKQSVACIQEAYYKNLNRGAFSVIFNETSHVKYRNQDEYVHSGLKVWSSRDNIFSYLRWPTRVKSICMNKSIFMNKFNGYMQQYHIFNMIYYILLWLYYYLKSSDTHSKVLQTKRCRNWVIWIEE